VDKAREEISEEEAIEILIKKKTAKGKTAALDFKEKQKISGPDGTRFPAGPDFK